MLKLFLDDERECPRGWVRAKSVDQAITIVQNYFRTGGKDWTHVSLDHDLGGDGPDGIKFLDWMIENDIWPTTKPLVHSMNPYGRDAMLRGIERYWPGRVSSRRGTSTQPVPE